MVLQPQTPEDLTRLLASATARKERVEGVDLSAFDRVIEHRPEDMTVTVQAGVSLARLQETLWTSRQWLPADPAFSDQISIAHLLAHNLSGPRRLGYGTIRDYLIGIRVALADGQIIKAGGKVVKNVAGYDLCKLFVGARNTLGIITEAVFKLRPLPETEAVLQARAASLDELAKLRSDVLSSRMEPVILDGVHLPNSWGSLTCVLGLAGAREDVEQQVEIARRLGFQEKSNTDYEAAFHGQESTPAKVSVLPSITIETLRQIQPKSFVARLGNGIIWYTGSSYRQQANMPERLMNRLKAAYDPFGILPFYSA